MTGRSWTAPKKPEHGLVVAVDRLERDAQRVRAFDQFMTVAASRTADVATAIIRAAPAPRATARKSRSASIVRSIASGPSAIGVAKLARQA